MLLASVGNIVAEWPQAWAVWHTRALSSVSTAFTAAGCSHSPPLFEGLFLTRSE